MVGSGMTVIAAKLRGHEAIGYDRDPLAVLIARSWVADVPPRQIGEKATDVTKRARALVNKLSVGNAYPQGADDETKKFVRYWFDTTNRKHLAALSQTIAQVRNPTVRDILWCGFSRLIIAKQSGVSLAMDVSHSRPHKSYERSPLVALHKFEDAVDRVVKACPFRSGDDSPPAVVKQGDARRLPLPDEHVDVVITSPPYLNAIDYIRGHKFSLIWMGHTIESLRNVRSFNIGTEVGSKAIDADEATDRIIGKMCKVVNLSPRHLGMLRHYVHDIRKVLSETERVLRPRGKAVFVVGNCNLRDVFVENSKCIAALGDELGMSATTIRSRILPQNRRYLPPPQCSGAGDRLDKRMREEVIITLLKSR
jgi:SAM-dependent methyltransferase